MQLYVICLSTRIEESKKYIFVCELTNDEEPTDKFKVFELIDKGVKEVKESDLLNKLLKYFSSSVNDMVKSLGGHA